MGLILRPFSYAKILLYDDGKRAQQLGGVVLRIEDYLEVVLHYLENENKEEPIDTGLKDRDGTPIKVGDYVFYHHKLTRKIRDDEDINDYPDDMVCGSGIRGYIYTGKERRIRGRVTYSLKYGVDLNLCGRYEWARWKDKEGNLARVEVVSRDMFLKGGGDIVPSCFFSR